MYVMGDNSVFKQASDAKLETELAKIEEKASIIYSDKCLEKVSNNSNDKPTMHEIVEELENQGEKIEEIAIDGDGITGISLDRETMTLGFGGTNKIKVKLLRSDTSTEYYAVVDGKYYKMHFYGGVVTIDRKPSKVSGTGTKQKLNMSNSDDTVATAILEESTDTIIVTATNQAGTTKVTVTCGGYTEECVITVKNLPVATAMELNSVRARIAAGYTRWLSAMTTPADALEEFEWSSSDNSVATVDNKGVVTARKAGTATITAKTTDGSNLSKTCEVTIVENAVDVATLTEIQTGEKNIIAKDENGNLITVPIGFKVLTSEGTKVTDGIVISDETGDGNGNEFVWVPIDSVSTGTAKIADDIRLGRYENFTTKNVAGNYIPKQDADNYTQTVTIDSLYQEFTSNSGNTAAKKLEDFVTKTKSNGGYYIARYEASGGNGNIIGSVKSQYDKASWVKITQPTAATNCQNMYQGNKFVESDLVNSYAWDTAIVFIQKYEDSNYAKQSSKNRGNTGTNQDKVCNIHDMASNYLEWSTEHSSYEYGGNYSPCVTRGGFHGNSLNTTSVRGMYATYEMNNWWSFRPLLYIK